MTHLSQPYGPILCAEPKKSGRNAGTAVRLLHSWTGGNAQAIGIRLIGVKLVGELTRWGWGDGHRPPAIQA